jgi:hypothetical protein
MLVMGYGITMDVEDLHYAVLDHDRSVASQSYTCASPARAISSNRRR